MRSDNPISTKEMIEQLRQHYPVTKTPVTYVGYSGNRIRTKDPIMIAPYYTMLLEKIGDDFSSTSSGKLSVFGILSPTTKSEKTLTPHSSSAVRSGGETEFRILVSYLGREAAAEIMDRNNNISSHRYACYNILSADEPMNIERIIDREKIPLGGSRPLQLINLTTRCAGFEFTYVQEEK
jgi:hypothetical protein